MPELEGFGGLALQSTHAAVPSLVIEGLQHLFLFEFIEHLHPQPAIEAGTQIAGRLFDIGAALDWIQSVPDPNIPTGNHAQRHVERRLLGVMTSHCLASIRSMYDPLTIILDSYFSTKKGQLPNSFRKLVERIKGGERYRYLERFAFDGVVEVSQAFEVCRKLRDGIFHIGYDVCGNFREGVPLIHISAKLHDAIGNVPISEGFPWYSVYDIIRFCLEGWLKFWELTNERAKAILQQRTQNSPERYRIVCFHSPTILRLAELLGNGSPQLGWWFIWPCGPDCMGSVGGCRNPAGDPPDTIKSASKKES
jgi:hypothetical protein